MGGISSLAPLPVPPQPPKPIRLPGEYIPTEKLEGIAYVNRIWQERLNEQDKRNQERLTEWSIKVALGGWVRTDDTKGRAT